MEKQQRYLLSFCECVPVCQVISVVETAATRLVGGLSAFAPQKRMWEVFYFTKRTMLADTFIIGFSSPRTSVSTNGAGTSP